MRRAGILVVMAALMAATGGTLAQSAGDGAMLLSLERQWNEALRTKNIAWFEQHLAGDLTDVSSGNGALHRKAEYLADVKADTTSYETLELSELRVRLQGNAGVVTGVNRIAGHDWRGGKFDVRLRFTDTYIKRNGRWLAWASQHTRIR